VGIEFCPLASGSSGNCAYLATENTRVLIDAGLSGVRIETALRALGVDPQGLDAVFVTHEHSDHVSGAGIIARRYGLPVFATEGTLKASRRLLERLKRGQTVSVISGSAFEFKDIVVRPFTIPHDAGEPVGYNFFHGGLKVTVATDMGHISDEGRESISGSDVLLIESNHDMDMLRNGTYPYVLKRRILGDKGHLSNVSCGVFLSEIASVAGGLRHVYLGHLSEENNDPYLAYETVRTILEANGVPVNESGGMSLYLADRHAVSKAVRILSEGEGQ
jgi:phosphoribosyl 1,2-cyclic phosphodiesterase